MPIPNLSRQCKQNSGFIPSPPLSLAPYQPSNRKCLLTLNNACLQLGTRLLWEKVNLALCSGEFTALLGDNGVGKTTLFNVLLEVQKLSAGKLDKSANLSIGYVPQLKMFDPKLPIRGRDLVGLGLDGGAYGLGFLSHFLTKKLLKTAHLNRRQNKHYLIDKAIDEVGGSHFANAPLNELSGGEQQRMRIAQALVAEPDLLLLDEPLLSLDGTSQAIVCDILAHRKMVHNTAILMISHEVLPIIPVMDKVIWLNNKTATTYLPADYFAKQSSLPLLAPDDFIKHRVIKPSYIEQHKQGEVA